MQSLEINPEFANGMKGSLSRDRRMTSLRVCEMDGHVECPVSSLCDIKKSYTIWYVLHSGTSLTGHFVRPKVLTIEQFHSGIATLTLYMYLYMYMYLCTVDWEIVGCRNNFLLFLTTEDLKY